MHEQYFEVGKTVGIRGLNGEIKVQPLCDNAQVFCKIKDFFWDSGLNKIELSYVKTYKSIVLMKIKNVSTPESAKAFLNKIIYTLKDNIVRNDGSYFVKDMIGLDVIDAIDGKYYGKLSDVTKLNCNDIYEVISLNGKKNYIPAVSEMISEIDILSRRILVKPIEGIFDNAD